MSPGNLNQCLNPNRFQGHTSAKQPPGSLCDARSFARNALKRFSLFKLPVSLRLTKLLQFVAHLPLRRLDFLQLLELRSSSSFGLSLSHVFSRLAHLLLKPLVFLNLALFFGASPSIAILPVSGPRNEDRDDD
jgi:hypothetical protein